MNELRNGNAHALRAIHTQFYPALRSFAGSLLGDPSAADDILNEIFITLWRKHKDFETIQNVKAFLYISTRNACINYSKKKQRDTRMKVGLSNYMAVDHEEFVLNQMIRAEVMQQIYNAIEDLPLQCRNVFKMSYVEGLSNPEIAEKFKISINTVKNHKVRALSLLRLKFLPLSAVVILALSFWAN